MCVKVAALTTPLATHGVAAVRMTQSVTYANRAGQTTPLATLVALAARMMLSAKFVNLGAQTIQQITTQATIVGAIEAGAANSPSG